MGVAAGLCASQGMDDARTAGTFTCRILCSGAIHFSEDAPLLKKLSCRAPSQMTQGKFYSSTAAVNAHA